MPAPPNKKMPAGWGPAGDGGDNQKSKGSDHPNKPSPPISQAEASALLARLDAARDQLDRAIFLMWWAMELQSLMRRDFFTAIHLDTASITREFAHLKRSAAAHQRGPKGLS